jgi:hypothetical protein
MSNSRVGQHQLEYTLNGFLSPTRSHVVRMWVSPQGVPAIGTAPSAVTIQKLGGTTASLQVTAEQAWGYFRLQWAATISASGFTLWRYVTENSRQFISAGTLASPAGTGAGITSAGQTTLTFRHALGGIGKIVLLESTNTGDAQIALVANPAGTPTARLAAYIMSADGIMIALDNAFPVTPLRDSRGQNEAVWRKINRA